jgi:hypothetical protein
MLAPSGYEVPSLSALICLLRDRKAWPKGFRWEWRDEKTCAVALANKKWKLGAPHYSDLAPHLNITVAEASLLFMRAPPQDDVQPEHVADRIEFFLAYGQL